LRSILLTGATGFVGSHLARSLLASSVTTRLLMRHRKTGGSTGCFPESTPISLFHGPGDTPAMRRALQGIDTVIHCAGATRALRRRDFYRINTGLTQQLLRLMKPEQRLVLISSQAAAGPSPEGDRIGENTACRPVNDYGLSKRMAEKAVIRWSRDTGGGAVILRPCAVYGPGDRDFYPLFRLAARGIRLLPPRPDQRISLIHVEDLVTAVLTASRNAPAGSTYFVSAGDHSWKEIARAIEAAVGIPHRLALTPPGRAVELAAALAEAAGRLCGTPSLLSRQKMREMKQDAWVCSSGLLADTLGWKPLLSLAEGAHRTAAGYRATGMLNENPF
jgi:dihydroflavonol-4-reductase